MYESIGTLPLVVFVMVRTVVLLAYLHPMAEKKEEQFVKYCLIFVLMFPSTLATNSLHFTSSV